MIRAIGATKIGRLFHEQNKRSRVLQAVPKHIFDASGTLDTCAHVLADPDSDENAIVNAMRSTHAVLKRLSAIRKSHADILSTMLDCDRDAFDSNTR